MRAASCGPTAITWSRQGATPASSCRAQASTASRKSHCFRTVAVLSDNPSIGICVSPLVTCEAYGEPIWVLSSEGAKLVRCLVPRRDDRGLLDRRTICRQCSRDDVGRCRNFGHPTSQMVSMLTRRDVLVLMGIAGTLAPWPARAQRPVRVVATFSILGDLVKSVGGERIDVSTLVKPNADVHVYSPTPN